MKTYLRKLVESLMAAGVVIQAVVPTFAENIQVQPKFQAVYEQYKDDEQFKCMYEEYGSEYASSFLKDVLENELQTGQKRAGGGNNCYQHVKNIQQTEGYNCGSTTVLQTLYGMDSAGNVKSKKSSDEEKIQQLDKDYHVDLQGSMYVYQTIDALNKYKGYGTNYVYVEGASISQVQFEGKIQDII